MASPAIKLLAAAGGAADIPPPTITSQVAVWWATDLVGAVADGAEVGDTSGGKNWIDRVSSLSLSQTVGTTYPLFDVDGIGGKPCVDFDGSNDRLRYAVASPVSTTTAGCIVVVLRCDDDPVASTQYVVSTSDDASSTRLLGLGYTPNASANRTVVVQNNGGTSDTVRGDTSLGATARVIELSSSGSAYTMRVDNVSQSLTVSSGSNAGDWFGDTSSRDNFTVGCLDRSTGVEGFFDGAIAFVLVADAELSAGDRTDLYDWINAYYGI
jgi:hypothetical protein